MTWYYEGKPFDPALIKDNEAFVYVIENLHNGRKYIGKKLFTKAKTKPKTKKRRRVQRLRVESDWQEYYGSNRELIEDVEKTGTDKFKRTILRLCRRKGEASYYEAKYIFETDAVLLDEYYNVWCSVRVRNTHLK
jgi:hypothetical protein